MPRAVVAACINFMYIRTQVKDNLSSDFVGEKYMVSMHDSAILYGTILYAGNYVSPLYSCC